MEPWRCSLKTKFNKESLLSQDLITGIIEIIKQWYGVINIFIATNTGWRHNSKMVDKTAMTPRREGPLATRPFPKLNYSCSLCLWLYFITHSLRQWLIIPCWWARATWALFLWPWPRCLSGPIALQRSSPRAASSAHSPPLLPHCSSARAGSAPELCLWCHIPPGCHRHRLG